MLTDGVVWIIVMFLSDSHSDGTHSLQSIHYWDTDAMLNISQKISARIIRIVLINTNIQ